MFYLFDDYGWFAGETADETAPRTTQVKPPAPQGNKRPNWAGTQWVLAEYVEPDLTPQLIARANALRAAAYRDEADPLYFKAQRGEATMEEWLAKVEEIKARYPN